MLVEPGCGCLPQRRIVEGVHFGAPAPMRLDKSGPLQHVEVLRDRLPRQASAILRNDAAQISNNDCPGRFARRSRMRRRIGSPSALKTLSSWSSSTPVNMQ
jgi:hypothetical protein